MGGRNTHCQKGTIRTFQWECECPHSFFIEVRCQNSILRRIRVAHVPVPAVNTKSGTVGLNFDQQMCVDAVWLLGSMQQSLCRMWRCCEETQSFHEPVSPRVCRMLLLLLTQGQFFWSSQLYRAVWGHRFWLGLGNHLRVCVFKLQVDTHDSSTLSSFAVITYKCQIVCVCVCRTSDIHTFVNLLVVSCTEILADLPAFFI